jgi:hypothetical protein
MSQISGWANSVERSLATRAQTAISEAKQPSQVSSLPVRFGVTMSFKLGMEEVLVTIVFLSLMWIWALLLVRIFQRWFVYQVGNCRPANTALIKPISSH